KWKDVFTYFDAIQIGLTATPADMVDRDTFRFFECEENAPSCLYTYDQAVKDGWLADFRVQVTSTQKQLEGIKPKDVPENIKDKLAEEGILEDSLFFEGTDIEKKVIITGTNEAIVKEFMDNCLMDKTGTLPAKSIFFAISKKHATRIYKAFEKLYPEYKGRLVEVITSDDSRAQTILENFKKKDFPRIAISVDMLDTGVDVPEVCNLVFAKPVFSKIKFWQMIGRGTRSNEICKHPEWLPNGKKDFFLIFDFWKNMDYFNMHPEGRESKPGEALPSKIFLARLQLYDYFLKNKDTENAELIKKKLLEDVDSLPKKTVSIREKEREINLVISGNLWKKAGYKPLDFLRSKIAPLIRFKQNVNLNTASFTLKLERLALAVLNNDKTTIDRLREDICEAINCLPHTIAKVKEKAKLLDKITDPFYWTNISYEDVLIMIEEVAPLMIYKRPNPVPKITLDIDDVIQQRKLIEFGPSTNPKQEYIEVYKDKVEKKVLKLAEDHPTMKKIKNNQILTENDLKKLEKTLNAPQLYVTENTLKKVYEEHDGTMVEFMKKILGLYKFPDAKQKINEAFKTFIVELDKKVHFNANQINFLRSLHSVFATKHHIAYRDFFEPPFTNIDYAPLPLFNKGQLYDMMTFCNNLEVSVFSS
ncbi:type I restriction endonuclease subunit R, partial [archaeon]|nr:type I restriction endonuclease subunit R [archaeon]